MAATRKLIVNLIYH